MIKTAGRGAFTQPRYRCFVASRGSGEGCVAVPAAVFIFVKKSRGNCFERFILCSYRFLGFWWFISASDVSIVSSE